MIVITDPEFFTFIDAVYFFLQCLIINRIEIQRFYSVNSVFIRMMIVSKQCLQPV